MPCRWSGRDGFRDPTPSFILFVPVKRRKRQRASPRSTLHFDRVKRHVNLQGKTRGLCLLEAICDRFHSVQTGSCHWPGPGPTCQGQQVPRHHFATATTSTGPLPHRASRTAPLPHRRRHVLRLLPSREPLSVSPAVIRQPPQGHALGKRVAGRHNGHTHDYRRHG